MNAHRIAALAPDNADAFVALCEGSGNACFCRYWHFAGGRADWLARLSGEPLRNRDEQLDAVARGAPEAQGLLAFDAGGRAIGWLKLAPHAVMTKLLRLGAYRRFEALGGHRKGDAEHKGDGDRKGDAEHKGDGDRKGDAERKGRAEDDGRWIIGCLLVAPEARRTGVARALVEAADEAVRALNGRLIDAYPREADHELHAEEAFMGTAALFLSCGFERIGGEGPYPICRKVLASRSADDQPG